MKTRPTKSEYQVEHRWMLVDDIPDVLAFEQSGFSIDERWDELRWKQELKPRDRIASVLLMEGVVFGAILVRYMHRCVEIKRIVVNSRARREGVGTGLVERLIERMNRGMFAVAKRDTLLADVSYYNTGAQLFFASMGFVATPLKHVVAFEKVLGGGDNSE
jgi:ribosomal protein S18 acetylase RimI-like enzyme